MSSSPGVAAALNAPPALRAAGPASPMPFHPTAPAAEDPSTTLCAKFPKRSELRNLSERAAADSLLKRACITDNLRQHRSTEDYPRAVSSRLLHGTSPDGDVEAGSGFAKCGARARVEMPSQANGRA